MTPREAFAAHALGGLLAHAGTIDAFDLARQAVGYADALLAALGGDPVAADADAVFGIEDLIDVLRALTDVYPPPAGKRHSAGIQGEVLRLDVWVGSTCVELHLTADEWAKTPEALVETIRQHLEGGGA